MARYHEILSSFLSLFRRRAQDAQLDEEVQFHLEMETRRNIAAGLSEAEARRRASRDFGGVEHQKDEVRDERRANWFFDGLSDLRFALRSLLHRPGLTVAATLTLALGIGATSAVFGVVKHVLLTPLAVRAARPRRRRVERMEGLRPDVALVRRVGRMEGARHRVLRHRPLYRRLGDDRRRLAGTRPRRRACTRTSSRSSAPSPSAAATSRRTKIVPAVRASRSSATSSGSVASAAIRRSSANRFRSRATRRSSSA